MIRKKPLLLILITSFTFGCEFNKTILKDINTGLTSFGDGLSCNKVYLSDGDKEINKTDFVFGERFYINFEDIEGFTKEGNKVFPGMELLIMSKKRDTILHNSDMYARNTDGFDNDPLLLQSNITVGNPMDSNNGYQYFINIWDKKGKSTFKTEGDFKVISNPEIKIESSGIAYDDIYLFSEKQNKVIADNSIKLNEECYMLFEGLKGFTEEAGNVHIGLSLKLTDSKGEILLDNVDLVGDAPMKSTTLKDQLAPKFKISSSEFVNPVTCEIEIWDKRSQNKIKVNTEVVVE